MHNYYFVFEPIAHFPYKDGFVKVIARSREEAIEIFEGKYNGGNIMLTPGIALYTEAEFKHTPMGKSGKGVCHDVLRVDDHMEIETSAGTIVVYRSIDPGAPGVSVMLRPKGKTCEVDLAYVEVKEDEEYQTDDRETPEDVCIYTYGDIFEEDYSHKSIIRRSDVLKALTEED